MSTIEETARAIDREAAAAMMIGLVEVPSPQTERLEDEPQVKAFIREAVEPRLRSFGITDIRYDSMGNLAARVGEGRSGRRMMLVTHAMNHPAATMPDPYVGKRIDGREHGLPGEAVLGRGLCEQKADMAAMLLAVEGLMNSGTQIAGELLFLCCTSGETGKHDALRNVIEELGLDADIGLIGGNSLQIRLGNRGRLDIFMRVQGEVCHSGSPHLGANAITGAMRVMDAVLTQARLPEPHPDVGACTMTFTHVRSFPDATHTLQGEVRLTLDRRLLPGEDPDVVFEEIAVIAREAATAPDPVSGRVFEVEVEKGPFMYPSLVAEDSEIVTLLRRASLRVLGYEPETHFGKSAFDQGYLNHIGIQTANYGPGEDVFAHTDRDMASIDRTRDGAAVIAASIHDYLGDE